MSLNEDDDHSAEVLTAFVPSFLLWKVVGTDVGEPLMIL